MKVGISIHGKRIERYFKTKDLAEEWLSSMAVIHSDKSLSGEVWRELPLFSNYQASDLGRLRAKRYKRSRLTKILRPAVSNDGYLKTVLQNDLGGYKSFTVHKLIAKAFYGEIPYGKEINHIDGDKLNNNINNLEYCTHSENCKHAVDNGLWEARQGELNGMSKLTKDQVLEAREAKRNNGRYWGRNEMAKKFGISAKHLQKIVNDKTSWMNV